jgi:hypothetical protein
MDRVSVLDLGEHTLSIAHGMLMTCRSTDGFQFGADIVKKIGAPSGIAILLSSRHNASLTYRVELTSQGSFA